MCVCRTSGLPKSRAWRLPTCIDYLPRQPAYCRRRCRRISSYLHSSAFSFFLSLLRDTDMIPNVFAFLTNSLDCSSPSRHCTWPGFPPAFTLGQAVLVSIVDHHQPLSYFFPIERDSLLLSPFTRDKGRGRNVHWSRSRRSSSTVYTLHSWRVGVI